MTDFALTTQFTSIIFPAPSAWLLPVVSQLRSSRLVEPFRVNTQRLETMKTDETKGEYKIEQRKREQAAMKRYAAIQKASEEKVCCQTIYVDIAGGIPEAFILDELIFFTLPRPETGKPGLRVWKEGLLWMAVSRSEWWTRKRLTPKEADGAIERLLKRNLIFKDQFLFNKQKTTHLRLNVPEFFKRYGAELEKQNPPEDEGDTILKDINDLYAMMGIPVKDTPEGIPDGEAGIPDGDKASLNGDSINNPHTFLTHPSNIGLPPNLPLEWQIGAGLETIVIPEQFEQEAKDSANLIATSGKPAYYGLAFAFMKTRKILISHSDTKAARKACKEMNEKHVRPEHVEEATRKLMNLRDKGGNPFVITNLFHVKETAINLANPVVETKPTEVRRTMPSFDKNGRVIHA